MGAVVRARRHVVLAIIAVCAYSIALGPIAAGSDGEPDTPVATPLSIVSADVRLAYEPGNCLLTITCDFSLLPTQDLNADRCRVYLPAGVEVLAEPSPPFTRFGQGRELWLISTLRAGSPQHLKIDYQLPLGSSSQPAATHYAHLGTDDAFWLKDLWSFLPDIAVDGHPVHVSSLLLSVQVPAGWRVFVPARPRPEEPDANQVSRQSWQFSAELSLQSGGRPWFGVFAGPYELLSTGKAGGASYELWVHPSCGRQIDPVVARMPDILGFLERFLGYLRPVHVVVIQPPNEAFGGFAYVDGVSQPLVTVPASSTPDSVPDWAQEAVMVHELTHALSCTGLDETFTQLAQTYYVMEVCPARIPEMISHYRARYWSATQEYAEPLTPQESFSVFYYVRPLLVWRMFAGIFGNQALVDVVHTLNRPENRSNATPGAGWPAEVRSAVGEVVGSRGLQFYDLWIAPESACSLDLGLSSGHCRSQAGVQRWEFAFWITEDTPTSALPQGALVDVAVELEDGTLWREQVALTGPNTEVHLSLPEQPTLVTLDPDLWLLDMNLENNSMVVETRSLPSLLLRLRWPLFGLLALAVLMCLARRRPVHAPAPPQLKRPPGRTAGPGT